MKKLLPLIILITAGSMTGCAWMKPWHHTAKPQPAPAPAASTTIVTPDESLGAKVIAVNAVGRFVVLNFPEGQMPKLEQHLFLYRGGLKVAEVKTVGPQEETSIVADMVSGDAQAGRHRPRPVNFNPRASAFFPRAAAPSSAAHLFCRASGG